jgi:ankyrin repeat protein
MAKRTGGPPGGAKKSARASSTSSTTIDNKTNAEKPAEKGGGPATVGTLTSVTTPAGATNAQTETNHDTALTLACVGGHASVVRLLLSQG